MPDLHFCGLNSCRGRSGGASAIFAVVLFIKMLEWYSHKFDNATLHRNKASFFEFFVAFRDKRVRDNALISYPFRWEKPKVQFLLYDILVY